VERQRLQRQLAMLFTLLLEILEVLERLLLLTIPSITIHALRLPALFPIKTSNKVSIGKEWVHLGTNNTI
jgi:hypothetical protein